MRLWMAILPILIGVSACGGGSQPDTRAAIEEAIDRHLSRRSDLDFASMTVQVAKIEMQGDDQAQATVSFQVGNNPEAGMQMVYDLRRESGVWEVQRTGGAGHGGGQTAPPANSGGDLPPDHPPIGSEPQSGQDLPAGHPPVQ